VRRGLRPALAWCLLALIGLLEPCSALAEPASEYQVKAAFLFNFAKFVKWPERALPDGSTSFDICVLGDHTVAPAVEDTISGKTLRDKRIVVKHLADPETAKSCQILFVSRSEEADPAKILHALEGASVLTVGEADQFAEHGGIINFKTEDNKIRFEINPDAAKRANLEVSSQLLKLAIIVRDRTPRN
jgi:hypothetical protein